LTEVEPKKPSLVVAMMRALRPKQWPKNGVLFAPLLFSKGFLTSDKPVRALVAVIAFSLLCSGVYVMNDWADREKDRLHPEKKLRPIAAGHLGGAAAAVLVALCWGGSGALGSWLGWPFLAVSAAYLVKQVLYTGKLKQLVVLDVMIIALGFILRVVAGAVAIDVVVSNWLLLCTLFLAVFLGFAKRRAELSSLEDNATSHRAALADYSLPLLDQMMAISAALSILTYSLYSVSKETVDHVGSDRLKYTVPIVVYGVFRYLFLVHKRGAGGAPEKVLFGDPPLQVDIGVYLAVAAWALYF
jgi:4-hydroxybenzoate polyprenyltransferase